MQARSVEQKQAKADAITDAALALHREVRFEDWTVQQVARRAGVAKGTVFLYFDSKEALGLAVAERLLAEWYEALDDGLAVLGPAVTPAALAQVVARTLEGRGPLRRSMALSPVLEHNAGRAAVERYRTWLLERSARTALLLESALPFLKAGEGLRLLLMVHAMIIGYHSMASPSPVVDAVLAAPALSPLRVEFGRVIAEVLWVQLEGLRALRGGRA